MKLECATAEDLLPLYVDEVCAPETRALVEAHLADCKACQAKLQKLQVPDAPAINRDIQPLKAVRRRALRTSWLLGGIIALAALAVIVPATLFFALKPAALPYENFDGADCLTVEADNENVTLLLRGKSASVDAIVPGLLGENGSRMTAYDKGTAEKLQMRTDENGVKHYSALVTFEAAGLTRLKSSLLDNTSAISDRVVLSIPLGGETDEKICDAVYYYEPDSDKMHLIWEREGE